MSIPWDLLETFLAVMRTGSLSAASRELEVAQPTIRRRVEALEESVGASLFTRGPTGLTPTDTARATLPACEAMEAASRAFERASSSQDPARGAVRIAASEVVAVEVLPGLLAPLATLARGLACEIVPSNRLVDLLRRDADVAIRMTTPTQAALVATRATRIPIGLFATRGLIGRRRPPRTLSELRGWPLVGPDQDRATLRAMGAAGLDAPREQFVLRSDADLVQLAGVRAGVGIGVCQVPLARRDPSLVRVVPSFELSLDAYVVMHEDQRRSPRVRAVYEHLVKALGDYGMAAGELRAGPTRGPRASRRPLAHGHGGLR